MNKPKLEKKIETVNQTRNSITLSHFIRVEGDEQWTHVGTVTHYSNGDSNLENNTVYHE